MQKHLNQVMVLSGQILYVHSHSNPVSHIALATVKQVTKTYNLFWNYHSAAKIVEQRLLRV